MDCILLESAQLAEYTCLDRDRCMLITDDLLFAYDTAYETTRIGDYIAQRSDAKK